MSAVEEPARPLLGYIAKFKDFVKEPPVAQLYYPDTETGRGQAESFVRQKDEKGFSIYSCIGRIHSPPRNKENVAELSHLILDLDLRNIREGREQVLDCLHKLVIPPDQIDDSGGGLHPIWHFKEPLTDEAGMAQAEAIMRRLVSLLAGDPKPTHRAALLRHVGSHNSRYGDWHECRIIESTGKRCDISEFEDMFDLYGEIPLLHYKEEDDAPLFNSEGKRLPVDLEAMRYQGKVGMNDTFLGYLGSALGKGEALADVIETIIEAAERNCRDDPNRPRWRHDLAEKASWWLEKHPEWTCTALSRKHEDAWLQAEGKRRRLVWKDGRGLEVRTYGAEVHNLDEHRERRKEEGPNSDEQDNEKKEDKKSKPRIRLKQYAAPDRTTIPRRNWLYGFHYMRRIVSATIGPGGIGKSSLDLVEAIGMSLARDLLGTEELRHPLRVWYHNGEDPEDEINRRIAAICIHFELDEQEVRKNLYVTCGLDMPIKVARGATEVKLDKALIGEITARIGDHSIDVAIFDPLVTVHSTSELLAATMDPVIREAFGFIANETDSAVELAHHTRKKAPGQDEYTAADARGTSGIVDAVRAIRVTNRMSKEEAEGYGIDELERENYVRVTKGKANMTRQGGSRWYRFDSVTLPNGDPENGIPGDDVGVLAAWEPPSLEVEISDEDRRWIVELVTANSMLAEAAQAKDWIGHPVGAHLDLDPDNKVDRGRLKRLLQKLVDRGTLRVVERTFPTKGHGVKTRKFMAPSATKG